MTENCKATMFIGGLAIWCGTQMFWHVDGWTAASLVGVWCLCIHALFSLFSKSDVEENNQ